ncbi:hypothetical protein [Mycolicibacterium sp. CBMA 226]|uniref:hypothetical protein n=1 Tax=Mycolicibacterium sp. CBMA 226 TaxID=2606611 RepID=UPI0012DDF74B|nr:hypothetical protein [Mycolicibacterium sp. CBMA 226]MUL76453.1 hypothetical protein [Mycolicibacterium sp. CBMA 226]
MFRLVESSNPDEVTRFRVRAHYEQRLVLIASVCRELQRSPDRIAGGRPTAALSMLSWWMRTVYDLPSGDVNYRHGLDDSRLMEFAADMKDELAAGSSVCDALAYAYTADHDYEFDRDAEDVRERLGRYLAGFYGGSESDAPAE